MTNFESVRKFMETFGQEIKEKAEFPKENIISLRYDLIKEELEELKEKSVLQDKEIEELVEKNKILRIAGGSNDGSSREVKFKINEIVREVDKCIAQLNQ